MRNISRNDEVRKLKKKVKQSDCGSRSLKIVLGFYFKVGRLRSSFIPVDFDNLMRRL